MKVTTILLILVALILLGLIPLQSFIDSSRNDIHTLQQSNSECYGDGRTHYQGNTPYSRTEWPVEVSECDVYSILKVGEDYDGVVVKISSTLNELANDNGNGWVKVSVWNGNNWVLVHSNTRSQEYAKKIYANTVDVTQYVFNGDFHIYDGYEHYIGNVVKFRVQTYCSRDGGFEDVCRSGLNYVDAIINYKQSSINIVENNSFSFFDELINLIRSWFSWLI